MISAVVLTKNEEKNIERCINSLLWCDEIVIIDDYSEDETINIIKNAKVKIFQRKLNGDFAGQRNFGLGKASGEWVLFVDSDEEVSRELREEILEILKHIRQAQCKQVQDGMNGFYINRVDYFLGKWLKYGETGDIKFLRLARKVGGEWKGRIHEVWEVTGKIGELKNPIQHFPHETVSEFLKEVNIYTDLVAQYWNEEGKKISYWEIVLYPIGKFIHNYIIRLGFLDGGEGFIMAAMMSFHSFLARGKYWLLRHNDKDT